MLINPAQNDFLPFLVIVWGHWQFLVVAMVVKSSGRPGIKPGTFVLWGGSDNHSFTIQKAKEIHKAVTVLSIPTRSVYE